MSVNRLLSLLCGVACCWLCWWTQGVQSHAYLADPPSRASAWLNDTDFRSCCINYNYNQMFCGGFAKMWGPGGNEGKCGVCGDSWDDEKPRDYEKGGAKYLGKITKRYEMNEVLDTTVQITANHLGFFQFRVCRLDDLTGEIEDEEEEGKGTRRLVSGGDATQECMDRTVLELAPGQKAGANGDNTKYKVEAHERTVPVKLLLPHNFTCHHCVLQWQYVCGNSWGTDPGTGKGCVGCGPKQENFWGCADIAIIDRNAPITTKPKPTTTTTTTKMTTTTTTKSTKKTSKASTEPQKRTTTEKSETESTKPKPETTTPESKPEPVVERSCKSKLEYGSQMPEVAGAVQAYCEHMCQNKCIIILRKNGQTDNHMIEIMEGEIDPNEIVNPSFSSIASDSSTKNETTANNESEDDEFIFEQKQKSKKFGRKFHNTFQLLKSKFPPRQPPVKVKQLNKSQFLFQQHTQDQRPASDWYDISDVAACLATCPQLCYCK